MLSFRYKKQTSRNVALTATRFEAKVVFLLWHSCWFMCKWTDAFADICFKLGLTRNFWNKQASRTLSRKQNHNFKRVFYLLLDCPTNNFGPFLRRQPHAPDVNLNLMKVTVSLVTRLCHKALPNTNWCLSSEIPLHVYT